MGSFYDKVNSDSSCLHNGEWKVLFEVVVWNLFRDCAIVLHIQSALCMWTLWCAPNIFFTAFWSVNFFEWISYVGSLVLLLLHSWTSYSDKIRKQREDKEQGIHNITILPLIFTSVILPRCTYPMTPWTKLNQIIILSRFHRVSFLNMSIALTH